MHNLQEVKYRSASILQDYGCASCEAYSTFLAYATTFTLPRTSDVVFLEVPEHRAPASNVFMKKVVAVGILYRKE